MTLFYFKPESYGQEYFVMAESIDEAINSLNKYLKKEYDNELIRMKEWKIVSQRSYSVELVTWDILKTKRGYTVYQYGPNQIVQTEIA